MPYATYRFNKIIAAETIRFIVTVAIVVYKGLKLVVYRMLTLICLCRELQAASRENGKANKECPVPSQNGIKHHCGAVKSLKKHRSRERKKNLAKKRINTLTNIPQNSTLKHLLNTIKTEDLGKEKNRQKSPPKRETFLLKKSFLCGKIPKNNRRCSAKGGEKKAGKTPRLRRVLIRVDIFFSQTFFYSNMFYSQQLNQIFC